MPTALTKLIRPDILADTAYQVADVPEGFIKLDAMESPYHPFAADGLKEQWLDSLRDVPVNLYPNPATCGLQQHLREAFGIPDAAAMALGNGSDEIIQFLTMLLARPGASVLAPEPGFVMYRRNAALFGMGYTGVALNKDFTLDCGAMLEALATHRPALVFIAYPNNPTGVPFRRQDIEKIISAAEGIVVIDEAYGAFSGDSFLPLAGSSDNLVVMRTVSKIGFAGIRLGYAAGSPALIGELAKILPPYNMNQLGIATAKFAMRHIGAVDAVVETLKAERSRLSQEMARIGRLKVFDSQANFITVRVPDAPALYDAFFRNRILVKKLHGAHPLLEHCLRITVGTPEQNDAVLHVLRETCSD